MNKNADIPYFYNSELILQVLFVLKYWDLLAKVQIEMPKFKNILLKFKVLHLKPCLGQSMKV